jgi:hypothetical protein
MSNQVDIQPYIDAVAELYPEITFSTGAAAQVENAYKIPGTELWINPDQSDITIDAGKLLKALKTAKNIRAAERTAVEGTNCLEAVVDHYITQLAANGYPNMNPWTLSLVLLDSTSQTDWKFCTPELKALLVEIAKTAP